MLTTIALTALMTTSAQSGAPQREADIALPNVNLRPADAETIPSNARMVAIPEYGGSFLFSAELTVGVGAAEPLELLERCTADGTTCLYEAPLPGLTEGTGATLTLNGDVNRSEAYQVGPVDILPPIAEFEAAAPTLLAVVNEADAVDHYSLVFDIETLSFDSDLALLEVQEIVEGIDPRAVYFSVLSKGRVSARFDAPLTVTEGEGCVALLIKDLAGNTTTVQGEAFCRKLSREAADEEVALDQPYADDGLGGPQLYCNHMGMEKTTPVGLGAVFFGLLALVRRRRRA